MFSSFFSDSYVKISMMAVDELLLACHSQGLNLFVKSLLSMIDKLLEGNNPEYQLLATNSVRTTKDFVSDFFHTRFRFWSVV